MQRRLLPTRTHAHTHTNTHTHTHTHREGWSPDCASASYSRCAHTQGGLYSYASTRKPQPPEQALQQALQDASLQEQLQVDSNPRAEAASRHGEAGGGGGGVEEEGRLKPAVGRKRKADDGDVGMGADAGGKRARGDGAGGESNGAGYEGGGSLRTSAASSGAKGGEVHEEEKRAAPAPAPAPAHKISLFDDRSVGWAVAVCLDVWAV
jgi:hypothetical protein